jgi:hypothetical protein
VRPRRLAGVGARPLNFTVRPQVCPITHSPPRTYSVLGYAAALCLLVSTGATLYYLVCFATPQLTSQGYKDLAAGVIQVPPIVVGCTGPEGLTPEEESSLIDKCLAASRRGALSDELQKEYRRGVHGVLVWGSMLVVSTILCCVSWPALRRDRKRAAV